MSFKNIKGQDSAIQLLQGSLQGGHLAASYLFLGPKGIGKKNAAVTLAKAINCQDNLVDSCDLCPACARIEKNEHPDFHLIGQRAALEESEAIKIEAIRGLQREIFLRPYEARKKVFIIDEAHNLTPEAQNALLKILEEPPKNSLIILITDKPALLFKTIISRCRIIKFSPLARTLLQGILEKECGVGEKEAHFLAYFCEGRIGEAIKLKDSGIFSEKNEIIDEFFFPARARGSMRIKDRIELRRCLNILTHFLRDIYLLKTGASHAELINSDRKQDLLKTMSSYSFDDLDEALKCICDSLLFAEQNINVKLILANLDALLNDRSHYG